jgi:hypothetical protein
MFESIWLKVQNWFNRLPVWIAGIVATLGGALLIAVVFFLVYQIINSRLWGMVFAVFYIYIIVCLGIGCSRNKW